MADTRHAEAIDAVARGVIDRMTERDAVLDVWDSFPDVGEDDWTAVADRVRELVAELHPDTPPGTYEGAYAFLADRAEPPTDPAGQQAGAKEGNR